MRKVARQNFSYFLVLIMNNFYPIQVKWFVALFWLLVIKDPIRNPFQLNLFGYDNFITNICIYLTENFDSFLPVFLANVLTLQDSVKYTIHYCNVLVLLFPYIYWLSLLQSIHKEKDIGCMAGLDDKIKMT